MGSVSFLQSSHGGVGGEGGGGDEEQRDEEGRENEVRVGNGMKELSRAIGRRGWQDMAMKLDLSS